MADYEQSVPWLLVVWGAGPDPSEMGRFGRLSNQVFCSNGRSCDGWLPLMPPVVIDVRSAEDLRDVVHRAVQALAEGKLVAFPTETVYGVTASALSPSGVTKLIDAKGRQSGHPLTLAIKSDGDALDYVPDISSLARRLARRCWPGPITLVLENDHPQSLLRQLPESVRHAVSPAKTIGLRVPAHRLILDVLQLLAGPLVLSSANRHGQADSLTAQEVADSIGDDLELVLDDGRSQFGQPSTVVRVGTSQLNVLRAGVVTDATLTRLSNFMVLVVCTGNTCRSPMAEVLCRKRVADRLGCKTNELEDRGVMVTSAGIAAMAGGRSTAEAVQVMADRGLDLSSHESQPVSGRLVRFADVILTMTQVHRQAIVAQWPDAAERTQLLCRDGGDLADPIGGPAELYRRCADQIDAQLEQCVPQFDLEGVVTTITPQP